MGIFSRMSNMIKAKVNNTLDEMENPIELLDQKLRDMEEQFNKAKLNSAQILGNVHEIEKKLNLAKKESADYEEKIKLALSKGNEDLAKKALARKVEIDKKVSSLQSRNNSIQLDSIERKIQRKESLAQGLGELKDLDNFDSEFEKLDEVDLDLELEKYKNNL